LPKIQIQHEKKIGYLLSLSEQIDLYKKNIQFLSFNTSENNVNFLKSIFKLCENKLINISKDNIQHYFKQENEDNSEKMILIQNCIDSANGKIY